MAKKYFQKSRLLWENDEKYGIDSERARENIIRLMSHTIRIFITYCFTTTTMVRQTCLDITFTRTIVCIISVYFRLKI